MKRPEYNEEIRRAAAVIWRKTMSQQGIRLIQKRGVQLIVRTIGGDALPIAANQMGRWK